MADPVTMLMIGGAVASTASSIIGGLGASSSADAEARAMELEARMARQLAERQAKEVTAQGFFGARQRRDEVADVLSTLQARAAASGGGATNPTVFSLIKQITERGEEGAQSEIRAGRQRAYQIRAQSILDSGVTGMRARALRQEGQMSALGSFIGGAGSALSGLARIPGLSSGGAAPTVSASGTASAGRLPSSSALGYARFR
jgi:hypothetical protein